MGNILNTNVQFDAGDKFITNENRQSATANDTTLTRPAPGVFNDSLDFDIFDIASPDSNTVKASAIRVDVGTATDISTTVPGELYMESVAVGATRQVRVQGNSPLVDSHKNWEFQAEINPINMSGGNFAYQRVFFFNDLDVVMVAVGLYRDIVNDYYIQYVLYDDVGGLIHSFSQNIGPSVTNFKIRLSSTEVGGTNTMRFWYNLDDAGWVLASVPISLDWTRSHYFFLQAAAFNGITSKGSWPYWQYNDATFQSNKWITPALWESPLQTFTNPLNWIEITYTVEPSALSSISKVEILDSGKVVKARRNYGGSGFPNNQPQPTTIRFEESDLDFGTFADIIGDFYIRVEFVTVDPTPTVMTEIAWEELIYKGVPFYIAAGG